MMLQRAYRAETVKAEPGNVENVLLVENLVTVWPAENTGIGNDGINQFHPVWRHANRHAVRVDRIDTDNRPAWSLPFQNRECVTVKK